MIIVYGRETCKLCKAACEKLELLGLEFEKREIDPLLALHDGWRTDGSVEVLAAYHANDGHLPVVMIDKVFLDYTKAMRKLKGR